jgi:hypothetical protein
LDYTDVQLKIIQQEGYDAHDFNIFDDRAAELWRKPYVDGAVRELTSGDSRSAEDLRRSVEQIMLAANDRNADVLATLHAGRVDHSNQVSPSCLATKTSRARACRKALIFASGLFQKLGRSYCAILYPGSGGTGSP